MIKVIPMIYAILCLLNTTLSYFNINVEILSYMGSVSLVTLILLYTLSYAFKFCEYHRMPLYYIIVNNLISIIDLYIGIPVSDYELLMIHSFIAGISIIITIILYVKCNKNTASKDYR